MLFTSEEGVLEGEGVEDAESLARADCETSLVLVETHMVDLLAGFVCGCADHHGRRINYCSHDFKNIINYISLSST